MKESEYKALEDVFVKQVEDNGPILEELFELYSEDDGKECPALLKKLLEMYMKMFSISISALKLLAALTREKKTDRIFIKMADATIMIFIAVLFMIKGYNEAGAILAGFGTGIMLPSLVIGYIEIWHHK